MGKSKAEVDKLLGNAEEMLGMVRTGLDDVLSGDPPRRRRGLLNLTAYGPSVIMVLDKLKRDDPAWYATTQVQVANEPLVAFFKTARNRLLHDGELRPDKEASLDGNPSLILRELMRNAPPNTKQVVIGDPLGGNGWVVEMPDGTTETIYFELPVGIGVVSTLSFEGIVRTPPITDTSVQNVGRLYVDFLTDLVRAAKANFTS